MNKRTLNLRECKSSHLMQIDTITIEVESIGIKYATLIYSSIIMNMDVLFLN